MRVGPLGLDADDDAGGDVGIASRAGQGAEGQFQILAELQPPVGVRQGHRALDERGDAFGGGIGNIVHRQDDDVIADAVTAIRTAITCQLHFFGFDHTLHLKVLTLWT